MKEALVIFYIYLIDSTDFEAQPPILQEQREEYIKFSTLGELKEKIKKAKEKFGEKDTFKLVAVHQVVLS